MIYFKEFPGKVSRIHFGLTTTPICNPNYILPGESAWKRYSACIEIGDPWYLV